MTTTTIKYEEGRTAALGRLGCLLHECGEVSPDVTYFVLREEAAYWRKLLLQHTDADMPSLPWLAYSRGGLDAVEDAWLAHNQAQATGTRLAA
jgi:hypothetical protein